MKQIKLFDQSTDNKELVAVCKENLIKDPLRLIRGPRLMAELGLSMDIQTKNWINKNLMNKRINFYGKSDYSNYLKEILND